MSFSLYRKYRPQRFSEVIGQDHIVKTLKAEILSGRISHAYLFTGPRGTGKTTSARLFAKTINCTNKGDDGEPCGECVVCRGYQTNQWPDLIEIDAASNGRVEEVRDLRELVRYTPQQSKYKVCIIDEVHMMSTGAFNALLKTLEEPPSHMIFILATTDPHKLPETIISRCQRFDFKRVPIDVLVKRLKTLTEKEGIEVDDDVIAHIARKAEGGVRDAESVLGQILALGEKHIGMEEASVVIPESNIEDVSEFTSSLLHHKSEECFTILTKWQEQGVGPEYYINELLTHVRSLILLRVEGGRQRIQEVFGTELSSRWSEQVKNVSLRDLNVLLRSLLKASQDVPLCEVVPWLPLEILIVEWQGTHKNTISSDLIDSSASTQEASEEVQENTMHEGEFHSLLRELRNALREESVSLGVLLKNCLITSPEGKLVFTFKYTFHAEKFKDIKNLRMIQSTWERLSGKKREIEVKIDTNIIIAQDGGALEEVKNEEVLKSALEIFGGEIVDSSGTTSA